MRRRHGVPEIEMEDDLAFSAIAHSDKQISRQMSTIVFSNALFIIVNVKCTTVNECRVAGVLRFTMAKKPVRLRRVIQYLVPIEVRSQQEQAEVRYS